MNRITITCLCTFGVAAALALQPVKPAPDATVSLRYDDSDGRFIEVIGVCDVTPDSIACWDAHGAKSESLATKVKEGNQRNSGEFSFRFGKKNRIVVVRWSSSRDSWSYTGENGDYLNSSGGYYSSEGPSEAYLRVSTDPSAKDYAFIAQRYSEIPGSTEIAFKKGERGSFDGVQFEIGPFNTTAAKVNPNYYGEQPKKPKGKAWRITLGQVRPKDYLGNPRFEVLNKERKPIRYVDNKGKQVSDLEYLSSAKDPNSPGYYNGQPSNPKYAQAVFNFDGPSTTDAVSVYTNIDPSLIGYIRITGSKQFRVLIKDIPLDPKD